MPGKRPHDIDINQSDVRDCGEVKTGQALLNRTKSVKDEVFAFVDSNIRWIRYGVYAVGVVGALVVIRSTRAMKVFRKISDIPEVYVTRHVTLQGTVENIAADCSLHVQHKPILSLPSFIASSDAGGQSLPVNIAGVQGSPAGRKWLLEKAKGQHVWFKLLEKSRDQERLDCLVSLGSKFIFKTVINKELVRSGLCRVREYPVIPTSPAHTHVIDRLVAVEAKRDRKTASQQKYRSAGSAIKRAANVVKKTVVMIFRFPSNVKNFFSRWGKK